MDAETDHALRGARGRHDIDVVATFTRAGIRQLWLVECKAWSRPVPKGKIIEFQGIVTDVGADRGIFLAERGYQKGALDAASNTNLLLTTLVDLTRLAEADLQSMWLQELDRRLALARRKLSALMIVERGSGGVSSTTAPGFDLGQWTHGLTALYAQLSVATDAVREARLGDYPVGYGWDFVADVVLTAKDAQTALPFLEEVASEIEQAVETADQSVRRSAT